MSQSNENADGVISTEKNEHSTDRVTTPDELEEKRDAEEAELDLKERSGDAVERNQFNLDDLPEDETNIDLTMTRADHIPSLGKFKKLDSLCVRNNLLSVISPTIVDLTTLTSLDLYENQLTKIENLDRLVNLTELDLSYNRIRKIEGLECLVNLKTLYLVHNKISVIEGLEKLTKLTLLELGDNRIRKLENLETLLQLETLYLGKNNIRKIENIGGLTNLRSLSVPGNRLVKIEGLETLTRLEELYLSDQGLENLDGLESLTTLTMLDVSGNKITTFSEIKNLTRLEDFWANDNQVSSWNEVEKLANLQHLSTVYLERNPIYRQDVGAYRRKVMLNVPQVSQIDATMCLVIHMSNGFRAQQRRYIKRVTGPVFTGYKAVSSERLLLPKRRFTMMESQKTLTSSTGNTFPSPEYFKKMKENYETGKIIYIQRRQGGPKPMSTVFPTRIAPATVMNSIRSSSYVPDAKEGQPTQKYVLRIPKTSSSSSSLLTSSTYDENSSGVYVPAIEPVRMQCLTVPLSMSMGGEYPYEEIEEEVVGEDEIKKEVQSLSPSSSQVSPKSSSSGLSEFEERKYSNHMIPLHNRLQPSRYTCTQPDCYYKGSSEIALRKHMTIHKTTVAYGGMKSNDPLRMPAVQPKPKGVKCSECETFAYSRPLLLRHMLDAHGIEAPLIRKTFINRESLQKWLDTLRDTHAVEFVVSSGSKKWGRGLQVHYLTCSRSGDQKERPNKKFVRPPRPSIKCGRNCMAYLKIKQNPTVSELQIEGCLHHSGHDIDHTRVVLEHNELEAVGRIVELIDEGLEISLDNVDQFRGQSIRETLKQIHSGILGSAGRFRLITDLGIITQMPIWMDQYRKSFFATGGSIHGQQFYRKSNYGKPYQRDITTSASLLGRRTIQAISTRKNDLNLRYHPIQMNRPAMRMNVVKTEPTDFSQSGPLTLSDVLGCSSMLPKGEPCFDLNNVKEEIEDEDAAAVAEIMREDDMKQEDNELLESPMIGGEDSGLQEDAYRSFMDLGDDLPPPGLSEICPTLGQLFGESSDLAEDFSLAQFSIDQELLGGLGSPIFEDVVSASIEDKF